MEKVLYVLTAATDDGDSDLRDRLLGPVADELLTLGGRGLEVSVVDAAVEPAAGHRIIPVSPAPAAIASLWLDSANAALRRPFDDVLAAAADHVDAHLVTESVPLADERSPVGGRSEGFVQVAFLRRPDALAVDEWLTRWLDDHTPVALATQDTWLYVQNRVVRGLGEVASPWDAIVEEGFPVAAMTDQHAFFAAADDAQLADHQERLFASVQRFVDLSSIQVVPMSRYVVPPVR